MQKENKVIFFPLKYFPTFLQYERLKNLQSEFHFFHINVEYQANGNKYEIMLRKQKMINKLRESFKIVR